MTGQPIPGPWRAELEGATPDDGWWMVRSETATAPDFRAGELPVVDLYHGGYDFADQGWPVEATARFIAAAPEMYAALQNATEFLMFYFTGMNASGNRVAEGDENITAEAEAAVKVALAALSKARNAT